MSYLKPNKFDRLFKNKEKTKNVKKNWFFELDVSSVVISTNSFGDFSKVTVVSELISEDDMKEIVESARKLWQKFIHQPQTARCLVFFLLLGEMCQKITLNYNEAIKRINFISQLNVSRIPELSLEWISESRYLSLKGDFQVVFPAD